MRYAIISDIHGNLSAFSAVLEDIERQGGADKIWCLGDIVGYGPEPQACVALLRQRDHIGVAGNHDLAAIGQIDTADFNSDAAAASRWTSQQLSPTDIEYLKNLPLAVQEGDFTLAHGSPRNPTWEYLTTTVIARENSSYFTTPYCLVGHSHIPLVFSHGEGDRWSARELLPDTAFTLGNNRLIINPGSVGQPRDHDSRASYAIYDSEAMQVRLYRVPYDIKSTQNSMLKHGLPERLATRLSYGV